jgi:hypothetical protein
VALVTFFCERHIPLEVLNDIPDRVKVVPEARSVLMFSFTTILFQIPLYEIFVDMTVNAVEEGGLQIVMQRMNGVFHGSMMMEMNRKIKLLLPLLHS